MSLSKTKKLVTSNWLLVIFILVLVVFFWPFLLGGKLPIPADTIVGMYHPWRDIVWDSFSAGVPFKNFLITDPVRQQFPWRQLAVDLIRQGELPFWNPYTHAGTPLLANFQSAVFYPLNLLYFFLDFYPTWVLQIVLQSLLGGIFLYFYLRQLKLKKTACLLGTLSFSFSGFFIAWLEWGTVLQAGLWLPLILLSIEKILKTKNKKQKTRWSILLIFSLSSSLFAGHLQTSFYLVLFSLIYLAWRLSQVKKDRLKLLLVFSIQYLVFSILTSVQWLPTLQFIKLSARGFDQINWQKPGWFIPWQNLVQFLAPDFFGNPTTLNYWGIFNYAEFVGYIGVIPLIFAFYAIFWRRDRKNLFFVAFFLVALSFALPTPWAKLPYKLKIPLLSTSQPTRLLFIVDFCLVILAALGLDFLLARLNDIYHLGRKRVFAHLLIFGFIYGTLWGFVLLTPRIWPSASWIANLAVSKRNLILPTAILGFFGSLVFITSEVAERTSRRWREKIVLGASLVVLLLVIFDLLRFGWKFTPFTKKDWLFPSTKTIEFLKKDQTIFRFMTTDRRLFAPNFSIPYKLQTVEGYDPLYLRRYGELIAASERGKPNISPPFGFNRIITPHNYQSRLIDLLNVKYVLSLKDEDSAKLIKVFQEGQTRVYENKNAFSRAFMVYDYRLAQNKQEAIDLLMDEKIDLAKTAILEEEPEAPRRWADALLRGERNEGKSNVSIVKYTSNQIIIDVETDAPGILILTDSYYPGWKAKIEGEETKIYRVDYNFRGIIIPEGSHEVVFKYGWH